MPRRRIAFIDSTLRDGQETLLGGRLRLELVIPILETLDGVGFQSIEGWGGGTFQASLSKLHENPWERLRLLRRHLKRTPIQMLLRGRFLVGNRPFSLGFVQRFLKHSSELGVGVVRLVDPLNNFQSLSKVAKCAKNLGLTTQGSVVCSYWDSHSERYNNIPSSIDLSCFDSLGIFDPLGTLSAEGAEEVVEMLIDAGVTEPFVHVHSLEGSAIAVGMKALEMGASVMDTCFSGIEGNRSFPSIESMLRNLEESHITHDLNLEALAEVSNFFQRLFQEYFARLPSIMWPVTSIDEALQGMRPTSSSLLLGREPMEGLDENRIRSELARMIVELRMPGIVAPLSEVLVRQAQLNLKSAKRYERLTDSFLELVRGGFGKVNVPLELLKYRDLEPKSTQERDTFEDRAVVPPRQGKLSEEDYLSFSIFSQEWEDMLKAHQKYSPRQLKEVIAATLATLAEGQMQTRPSARVPEKEGPQNRYSRWRESSGSNEVYLPRTRAFIQEPF